MNRLQSQKALSRMILLLAIAPRLHAMVSSIHTPPRNKTTQKATINRATQDLKNELLIQTTRDKASIDAQDNDGNTALHHAMQHHDRNKVRTLIAAGANPNIKNLRGQTAWNRGSSLMLNALTDAVLTRDRLGERPVVRISQEKDNTSLLSPEKQAQLNLSLTDAAGHADARRVGLLIGKKAQVSWQNSMGHTPLMIASLNGHDDIVRMLLTEKANVSLKDKSGKTALMHAARRHHLKETKALLRASSSVNDRDNEGNTALHMAVNIEDENIASELVLAGAHPFVINKQDKTAFDSATDTLKRRIAFALHLKTMALQNQQCEILRSAL